MLYQGLSNRITATILVTWTKQQNHMYGNTAVARAKQQTHTKFALLQQVLSVKTAFVLPLVLADQ